jgi:hypothetical protein
VPLMAAALGAVVEGGEGVEAARGEVADALMRARWGEEAARGGRGGAGERWSAVCPWGRMGRPEVEEALTCGPHTSAGERGEKRGRGAGPRGPEVERGSGPRGEKEEGRKVGRGLGLGLDRLFFFKSFLTHLFNTF